MKPRDDKTSHPRLQGGPVLWVIMGGSAATAMVYTALGPILPEIAEKWGGGENAAALAQLVATMPGLGTVAGGVLAGWVVRRFGIFRVMLGALLAYGIFGVGGVYTGTAPGLLASRAALGMSAAFLATAILKLVADVYGAGGGGRIIGYRNAFGQGCGVLAIFAVGLLARSFGIAAPFALYPVMAVLLMPLVLAAWRQHGTLQLPVEQVPQTGSEPRRKSGDLRPVIPFFALAVLCMIVTLVPATQFGFLMRSDQISDPRLISLVVGVCGIGAIAAGLSYGPIERRIGPLRTFRSSIVLNIMGLTIAGLGHDLTTFLIGSIVMGAAAGTYAPYLGQAVIMRAAPQARAQALGLLTSATFLGVFLSPIAFLPLRNMFDIHHAFLVLAALLAAAIAPYLALSLRADRRRPATPDSAD